MPNDNGNQWKKHYKKAATKVQQKTCETCQEKKNIKEFSWCPGGTYQRKERCKKCDPPPKSFQCGTSKKFRSKKDYQEIKPAYIQTATELTRSVLRISDQEQIEVKIED